MIPADARNRHRLETLCRCGEPGGLKQLWARENDYGRSDARCVVSSPAGQSKGGDSSEIFASSPLFPSSPEGMLQLFSSPASLRKRSLSSCRWGGVLASKVSKTTVTSCDGLDWSSSGESGKPDTFLSHWLGLAHTGRTAMGWIIRLGWALPTRQSGRLVGL